MTKGEFVARSLPRITLKPGDITELQAFVNATLEPNLMKYLHFTNVNKNKVNLKTWKYLKTKKQIKIYVERREPQQRSACRAPSMSDGDAELQSMLCTGSTPGDLNDIMLGILTPLVESTSLDSSSSDNRSRSTVLSIAKAPTSDYPYQSMVVSWMELDMRRRSMGLVKNRDYIYVEATGTKILPNNLQLGYRLLHSVDFAQAHALEGRVRAQLSVCCFFRQEKESSVSVFMSGMMNSIPHGVRRLIIPRFIKTMLSPLKYVHSRERHKLTEALGQKLAALQLTKSRDVDCICATCKRRLGRLGQLVRPHSTCTSCFGYVCNPCKVMRELHFVTFDLTLTQRQVAFCLSCANNSVVASLVEPKCRSNVRSMKGRFTINPFRELVLTETDIDNLHEISSAILDSNLSRYEDFLHVDEGQVDPSHWKLVKSRESLRVFQERTTGSYRAAAPVPQTSSSSSDLPSLLCVGTKVGEMEDIMFGVVNPTLENMRIKASYVEDLSGAAVLANIVDPTIDKPFDSLVIKWMEIDIPLQSTGFVRNRDYIYIEVTGFAHLASGEKVGYHIMHSVSFPETYDLPGRVRARLSICGFFRQVRPNVSEIFLTGLMDPGGDMIRMLVLPTITNAFLSSLKYAHCGQMKKLQHILEKRYAEAKELGTPNRELVCVTCNVQITNRKLGDFAKSDATCKLCFGYVCHSCKIQRKLSFVTPDLLLAKRKVTFCAVCLNDAIKAPAADAARTQILSMTRGLSKAHMYYHNSEVSTTSEYASSSG
ncbi:hypothetical protein PsorP6_017783 [Peronosclerospora sorghi]|uniref:Uncharacterized protein n=1 Tax=Peronosclerospora sorghi TaxID=230839 RepID=A0ACC0WMU9_9STRA|nr:hypothetical protein PsorP6_017783 [Peronosclerospora sorghi]